MRSLPNSTSQPRFTRPERPGALSRPAHWICLVLVCLMVLGTPGGVWIQALGVPDAGNTGSIAANDLTDLSPERVSTDSTDMTRRMFVKRALPQGCLPTPSNSDADADVDDDNDESSPSTFAHGSSDVSVEEALHLRRPSRTYAEERRSDPGTFAVHFDIETEMRI